VIWDDGMREEPRIARIGKRLVQAAMFARAFEPMLILLTVVAAAALQTTPVMAQTPGGGSIFGGSDQTVGSGVREAIRWARNILFLLGVGGCAWGALNVMMEKPYLKQFIGGGASMGFGAIAALAHSFAQGEAVNVDTDLGE
jgi:hypothetical protein